MAYDKSMYFFNLRSTLKQPQMIAVTDVSDTEYLPIPDDMLVNLNDSYDIISTLLDSLETYFADSPVNANELSLIPALTTAFNISKHIGGRILLFQASQVIQKLPELQIKPEAVKDTHAKFSSSNLYF